MARRRSVFPRNDNLVYIRGLVDEDDAKNADGSPKWVNGATVAWDVRTAEYPAGVVVASGVGVAEGDGGAYKCELPNTMAISVNTDYWFHATVTAVLVAGTFVADFSDSFETLARTGRTPVT